MKKLIGTINKNDTKRSTKNSFSYYSHRIHSYIHLLIFICISFTVRFSVVIHFQLRTIITITLNYPFKMVTFELTRLLLFIITLTITNGTTIKYDNKKVISRFCARKVLLLCKHYFCHERWKR